MKLSGKLIVVTGGSSGIGKQIVLDSILEGATVVVLARNKKAINRIVEGENVKGKLFGFQCDILDVKKVAQTFDDIKQRIGNVYGLVNNAGINPSRNNILETSHKDWSNTIDVNLTGPFNCSKAALPHMLDAGEGSIVNISSIAGIRAIEQRAAYMSSKWGLIGLSQSAALDFAKSQIRINCICPGFIETPLTKKYIMDLTKREYNKLVQAHPMGRLGTTSDVSKAVLFLLSDEASWVTGAILPVDGGYSAGKKS